MTVLALVIREATVIALAELAGSGLPKAFDHASPGWIAVVAAAELATYPAYLLAYRSLSQLGNGAPPPLSALARMVLAGFGPVALAGGFAVDTRAWRAFGSEQDARCRVQAMAGIEWAILAPVTWIVATTLLVQHASISATMLWPWAIGVPLGLLAAARLTNRGRSRSAHHGRRCTTQLLNSISSALQSTRTVLTHPWGFRGAWIGVTLYWAAEIAAFNAALRAAGVSLGIGPAVVAYATGYLASRRSLPLGGAGLTELMLVYALWEMSVKVGPAVLAVLIYRMFNFVIVAGPALAASQPA